jgi:hypothetical protein
MRPAVPVLVPRGADQRGGSPQAAACGLPASVRGVAARSAQRAEWPDAPVPAPRAEAAAPDDWQPAARFAQAALLRPAAEPGAALPLVAELLDAAQRLAAAQAALVLEPAALEPVALSEPEALLRAAVGARDGLPAGLHSAQAPGRGALARFLRASFYLLRASSYRPRDPPGRQ